MEIWRYIEGFEGLYRISTKGNVVSLGKGKSTNPEFCKVREIKPRIKNNGYVQVKISKDGKRYHFTLHRLVAMTFLMNNDNKPEVNHIDGNKQNNDITNLEWVTSSENQKHAFKIGKQKAIKDIDNKQSIKIRQLDLDGNIIYEWDSINQVKREIGFNTFGIIKCCKKEKKFKTAYGYKWEYV
jgi:hypothetical protein